MFLPINDLFARLYKYFNRNVYSLLILFDYIIADVLILS